MSISYTWGTSQRKWPADASDLPDDSPDGEPKSEASRLVKKVQKILTHQLPQPLQRRNGLKARLPFSFLVILPLPPWSAVPSLAFVAPCHPPTGTSTASSSHTFNTLPQPRSRFPPTRIGPHQRIDSEQGCCLLSFTRCLRNAKYKIGNHNRQQELPNSSCTTTLHERHPPHSFRSTESNAASMDSFRKLPYVYRPRAHQSSKRIDALSRAGSRA